MPLTSTGGLANSAQVGCQGKEGDGQSATQKSKFRTRRPAAATANWPGGPIGLPSPTRFRANRRPIVLHSHGPRVTGRWNIPAAELVALVGMLLHEADVSLGGDTLASPRSPKRAAE